MSRRAARCLTVELVPSSSWEEKLVPAWEDLLERSLDSTVFLSPEWILSWWRHFQDDRFAHLLAAWDEDGRLCGLAPFYLRRIHWPGSHNSFSLGFMSDSEVGSEYLGMLVLPEFEDSFINAVAKKLQGQWVLADLRGLKQNGVLPQRIVEVFGTQTANRLYKERHPCSLIPLPSDYEAYLSALPHKFRSNIRYRTNKLTKTFNVRLIRTSQEEEIEPHLETLFSMHQARWRAEGNTGSFYDRRKCAFYRDVSTAFLRKGWLRFYHLEVDGIIRASQFGFAFRGVLHSLQEAFDHEFSPRGIGGLGIVLRAMVIKESIAEGLREYDFLGGTEEYKVRWGTVTHYTHRVRIGAPGFKGALAFSTRAGFLKMKDWGRQRSPQWLLKVHRHFASWAEYRRARRIRAHSIEVQA